MVVRAELERGLTLPASWYSNVCRHPGHGVVGTEDVALVESVHRGLRSGALEHGRLPLDSVHLVRHFQLLVRDALVG